MLYEKIRLIKYPFTVLFVNMIKVEIKLGYFAWIEVLYKKNLLNKLKSTANSIRFLSVCKHVVLAQLEFDLGKNGLENLWVEAGTIMALTWTSMGVEKSIEAKNFTINNWMSLQDA